MSNFNSAAAEDRNSDTAEDSERDMYLSVSLLEHVPAVAQHPESAEVRQSWEGGPTDSGDRP